VRRIFLGKCAKIPNLLLANNSEIMKKSVEFSKESITVIESGKKVVGQVFIDQVSGKLTFKQFNRNKRKKDTVIMALESGWLKESATRMKFFSSVKKAAGAKCIGRAMNRDLCISLNAMDKYFETYGKEGE